MNSQLYPERPGELDCAYYLDTGYCQYGRYCRYNHPPDRELAVERMKGTHPERIGKTVCQYYARTGTCKFGPTCKFHHPKDDPKDNPESESVLLNDKGYPLRSNAKECNFYLQFGWCKFSKTCKFNHPEPSNSMLSPSQQSYPGTQTILPQGLAPVSRLNAYPEKSDYASSIERQQQNSSNVQFVGPIRQRETFMGSSASSSSLPVRLGEPDCPFLAKTGSCKFGAICRFNHPIENMTFSSDYMLSPVDLPPRQGKLKFASSPESQQNSGKGQFVGTSHRSETAMGSSTSFSPVSVRPGKFDCPFSAKTGSCKFGTRCRFNHSRIKTSLSSNCMLSPEGLPLRPGEPKCISYCSYGLCINGPTCKFDHPLAAHEGIITESLSTSSSDGPSVQPP